MYGSSISAAASSLNGRPIPANPGYPASISSLAETESASRAKKSHGRRWKVSAASSDSQHVVGRVEQLDELRLRHLGDGEVRNELRDGAFVHPIRRDVVGDHAHGVAGDEPVLAERLPREEHAA